MTDRHGQSLPAPNPLTTQQAAASDPQTSAWVAASAGTGKTQVLTARVLRLMLAGARPESILCLTYTRAAAAEMAERIYSTLAQWSSSPDLHLRAALKALDQPDDAETCSRARALFARALDASGGLRIQTLHAFAQSVLARFPIEAQVQPGFGTLDATRTGQTLRDLLSLMVFRAQRDGERQLLDDLEQVSMHIGQEKLPALLTRLADLATRLDGLKLPPDQFEAVLRESFGLPRSGNQTDWLRAQLNAGALDEAALRQVAAASSKSSKKFVAQGEAMTAWLALPIDERLAQFETLLVGAIMTTKFAVRQIPVNNGTTKERPELLDCWARVSEQILALFENYSHFDVVSLTACFWRLSWRLGKQFEGYKMHVGRLGFSDLIQRLALLFRAPGRSAWVRYKLDVAIDHILVDEAQDTNDDQWSIVDSLAQEYFAGIGSTGSDSRTMFAVGDIKQAIFGFQGTDPKSFIAAHGRFDQAIHDAGQHLANVPLTRSFRSAQAVLDVVDAVLDDIGPEAMGQQGAVLEPHIASRTGAGGEVMVWPLLKTEKVDVGEWTADAESQDDTKTATLLAGRIAEQVRHWLDRGERLPDRSRPLAPGDILILLTKRSAMAQPLIAALTAQNIPVAGLDRLLLSAAAPVQHLMALMRFALLPADDLSLAEVLRSALLGWDEDTLMQLAHPRGRDMTLWQALNAAARQEPPFGRLAHAAAPRALDWLTRVLKLADALAPYEFLQTVMLAMGGRSRLLAQMGSAASQPIDLLLDAALRFEAEDAPSLQAFLRWLQDSDEELKREPGVATNELRIMTIHGAKGLQAPVVILADAFGPGKQHETTIDMPFTAADGQTLLLPVWHGPKDRNVRGRLETARAAAIAVAAQEANRLLYVAMTRAEDRLCVAGWIPAKNGNGIDWYAPITKAVKALGGKEIEHPLWPEGNVLCFSQSQQRPVRPAEQLPVATPGCDVPDWARQPPRIEPGLPRPLTPSRSFPEVAAGPPPYPVVSATRRGSLMHALFERLPDVPDAARADVAARWLARHAPDLPGEARSGMSGPVLQILNDDAFAPLFGPGSRAEVPIVAVLGDVVIQGQVDRLLVGDDLVQLIDLKTGVRVPATAQGVPTAYLQQMAAYRAALQLAFPGRAVEASLLWTATAHLMPLPADLLDQHLPPSGYAGPA